MKVLHIMDYDIYHGVLIGGPQVAKRNHQLLESIFGKRNTYLLMFSKYCSGNYGEGVYTLPLCTNPLEVIWDAIRGYRRFRPKSRKDIKKILDKIEPDIVFIDSSELGQITKLFRKETKCIVHVHNVEVDYVWKNRIRRKKISGFPVLYAAFINERLSVKHADKIICLNERDNKRLQEVYRRKADLLLPVSFEDKFNADKIHRNIMERKLLFIGSLFPPNEQGVKWFIEKVMPQLPDFELTIVGRGFEEKKKELERKNVKVVGTVDDLEKYYYSYSSMIMPILYGDGMKVKTAEAMMYGMNIFATKEALEGYQTENVKGIYRCNTEDEFANSIRDSFNRHEILECAWNVRKSFLENNEISGQIDRLREIVNHL